MHINAPINVTGDGTRWSSCARCRKVFGLNEGFSEGSHLCCGGCGQNLLLKKMSNVEWEALTEQYPQPLSPVMTTTRTPHGGNDYVVGCECPGCCQFRERAKAIGCTPFELAQEMTKFLADHFKLPTSTIGAEFRKQIQPSKMPMWGSCRGMGGEIAKALKERGFMIRTNTGERPRVADITGFAAGRRFEFDGGGGKTALMLGTEVHQAMDASQRNEKLKQELIRQYTNAAAYKLGASATLGVESDRQKRKQKEIKDYLATCLVVIGCTYRETGDIIRELVEGLKNV